MCTNHINFSVERLLSDESSNSQQLRILDGCENYGLKDFSDSNEANFKSNGNNSITKQPSNEKHITAVQCKNPDRVLIKRPLPIKVKPFDIGE